MPTLPATVSRSPRVSQIIKLRPRALALAGSLLSLATVLLCLAQSANAVTVSAGGAQFGVQPETAEQLTEISEPLSYGGGPVVHSSASYALYWDHRAGAMNGEWEREISGFLMGAGADNGKRLNDFAVLTQYHDTTGAKAAYDQTFRGDYTDTDAYPSSGNCSEGAPCVTDAQIRTELTKYIKDVGLPTGLNPSSGPTPIYYVFTPPGVTVCLTTTGEHCSSPTSTHPLCSYHSFIAAGGQLSTVLYAVQPWTAGNFGTFQSPQVSGTNCQDGKGEIEEPNQIGLGPEGEYAAGLGDLIVNDVATEALSTITNPLFNAWHDTGDANEVVDKCRNDFLGGELQLPIAPPDPKTKAGKAFNQTLGGVHYYLNDVYNQAAAFAPYPGVPCVNGVNLVPAFTAQNPIRSGDVATFSATQSDVTLGVQKYSWSFGDGTGTAVDCEGRVPTNGFAPQECTGTSGTNITNPVASTQHLYTYGGSYTVTLTLVDYGGNTETVSHQVTVSGPAPPAPPAPTPGGGSTPNTSSPGTTTNGKTPGAPGTTGHAPPAATQAVVSRKLPSVLKNGLVIRYSVSEQVAGRFEVLLASSLAHKLGIHGATATGLTKGTAPQTIIAKAIVVTTKGGHSTYKLKLSKTTSSRLRKLPKVALMIRLVVHNASSPAVTTVLNTVNLSR